MFLESPIPLSLVALPLTLTTALLLGVLDALVVTFCAGQTRLTVCAPQST